MSTGCDSLDGMARIGFGQGGCGSPPSAMSAGCDSLDGMVSIGFGQGGCGSPPSAFCVVDCWPHTHEIESDAASDTVANRIEHDTLRKVIVFLLMLEFGPWANFRILLEAIFYPV